MSDDDNREQDILEGDLMTSKQTAEFLGVSAATLAVWRCRSGKVDLPFVKIGASVRYSRKLLIEWLGQHVVNPVKEIDDGL